MTTTNSRNMLGSALAHCNELLLLLLFISFFAFSQSVDYSSRCSLPPEHLALSPPPILLSHQKLCSCQSDWADVFCARLSIYERMAPEKAPSICVCRQSFGGFGGCVQFLTRCFRRRSATAIDGTAQHRLRRDQCACCFNQPDSFCTQLDCAQMRPQFDANANTSCHCHLPKIGGGPYAPSSLCGPQSQLFTREVAPQPNSAENAFGHTNGGPDDAPAGSSFRPSFRALSPSVSSPLVRFFAMLLLALVAVSLTAAAICFLNNWKRIRLRQMEGAKGAQQQKRQMVSKSNGLLEEATV